MHLVAYNGVLFAADAYWFDSRNIWYGGTDLTIGWAQILRLDKPGGKWVVDLELGRQFLRPEILKSVTFTVDAAGRPLAQAVNLLVSAAFPPGREMSKSPCSRATTRLANGPRASSTPGRSRKTKENFPCGLCASTATKSPASIRLRA